MKKLAVEEIADKIDMTLPMWMGHCYEVACKIVEKKLVKGKARYGFWMGPIAEGSMFSGKVFVRHGWIELENKDIIDPTRWIFEGAQPYIFYGKNDQGFYDMGMNKFRELLRKPCPEYNPKEKQFSIPEQHKHIFKAYLPESVSNKLSVGQVFWLANIPLSGDDVQYISDLKVIYSWLEKNGCKPFIPTDNWKYVMG